MQKDFSKENPYCLENVPLFKILYGKHLISLGGTAAIDQMFAGINLQGLQALDLGFGLGGVAFYLAEKYQLTISGIEIHSWMVNYAKKNAPLKIAPLLNFHTYTSENTLPYNPATFDIVYSKGVLNHVADKNTLFNQVNTVLKPNGLFIIADWIFPKIIHDDTSPLVCETQTSYQKILLNTGFDEIQFHNNSQLFFSYTKKLLANLSQHQTFIKQNYGEQLFLAIKKQHEELIIKIKQQQKFAVRIIAKKIN